MAGGWLRDGAVQDQIDASVDEAVERAREELGTGISTRVCANCGESIAEARRKAIPGVQLCILCQVARENNSSQIPGRNRQRA